MLRVQRVKAEGPGLSRRVTAFHCKTTEGKPIIAVDMCCRASI